MLRGLHQTSRRWKGLEQQKESMGSGLSGDHYKKIPGIGSDLLREGHWVWFSSLLVDGTKLMNLKKKKNFQEVVFRQQNVAVH